MLSIDKHSSKLIYIPVPDLATLGTLGTVAQQLAQVQLAAIYTRRILVDLGLQATRIY